MLEVPAAAICIDSLLQEVDFVSIGSNDLVQYLMAADRDNPQVSHLCQPLSPAVLQVLSRTIASTTAAGTPVHALRRDGRPAAGLRAALRHGPAQLQHEPGVHSDDQGADAPSDARAEPKRSSAAALKLKTTAEVKRYLGEQISRDRAESEAAGYGVS